MVLADGVLTVAAVELVRASSELEIVTNEVSDLDVFAALGVNVRFRAYAVVSREGIIARATEQDIVAGDHVLHLVATTTPENHENVLLKHAEIEILFN